MRRLARHLVSEFGGAWELAEIDYYQAPSVAGLMDRLKGIRATRPDFLLVAFSGHGFENGQGKPFICLQDREYLAVDDLHTGVARQVTIIDACRVVAQGVLTERAVKTASDVSGVEDPGYRASCRKAFDAQLQAVPTGAALLQACSSGQTSSDYPTGGLFMHSLVNRASAVASSYTDWQRCSKWNSVGKCFLAAREETRRINNQQVPISTVWDQGANLPFLVA
jgi:hypothetical protein